jgi:hypothetical protein
MFRNVLIIFMDTFGMIGMNTLFYLSGDFC